MYSITHEMGAHVLGVNSLINDPPQSHQLNDDSMRGRHFFQDKQKNENLIGLP